MARRYDSSRRKAEARRTRERILDQAVELHREGITAYEPLAEAAGVSTATVRKHFPNRESIFEGCTRHFFGTFTPPRLEAAAGLTDPSDRAAYVATEMCGAHEQIHDLLWHAYAEAHTSEALAGAIEQYGELVDAATAAVVEEEAAQRRVRALLDPLTYRAFRVQVGLDPASVQRELAALLREAVVRSDS